MNSSQFDQAREQMLRRQLQARAIHDRRVLAAMARVPREQFVDAAARDHAYADRALPIDCGQTISQPYIVGLMSQGLGCRGNETVLEIGTGSGYQTAVLAEIAQEVISIERHEELSKRAAARLADLGYRNVTLIVGDGTLGWPARAPYDRIMVTAAALGCPAALFDQLREGGRVVIPVGGHDCQTLKVVTKVGGARDEIDLAPCRFVPLVGAQGWPEPPAGD
jgi:protein-L-isoaspartate(D-aspartate) O-methyltransferase